MKNQQSHPTHAPDLRTIAELGDEFVAANDKPLDKPYVDKWLRLECIGVEIAAWLLLVGFVWFAVYVYTQIK